MFWTAFAALVLIQPTNTPTSDLPPEPHRAVQSLPPDERRFVLEWAKHVYRLPDGTYLDASNYGTVLKILKRSMREVPVFKERRWDGYLRKAKVGEKMSLVESEDTRAWGLAYDDQAQRIILNSRTVPPLMRCIPERRVQDYVVIVDADLHRAVRGTDDQRPPEMRVHTRESDNVVTVSVDPSIVWSGNNEVFRRTFLVNLSPQDVRNSKGLGSFVLWPDPTLQGPDGSAPIAATACRDDDYWEECGPDAYRVSRDGLEAFAGGLGHNVVHRAIPLDALRLTPDQLLEAIDNGEIRPERWTYKVDPDLDSIYWVREDVYISMPR